MNEATMKLGKALLLASLGLSQLGGCASSAARESPADAAITAKVKQALSTQTAIYPPNVDVGTHDGVVQLAGFVNSDYDARRAVEVAQRVEGVKNVRTALIAPSGGPRRR